MGRLFSVFFLILTGIGVFFAIQSKQFSVNSPIPKVYGSKREAINTFFPKETSNTASGTNLNLSAKSAILVDYDTGEIVYERNPKLHLPGASTDKIMTALVALETGSVANTYTVSDFAAGIGEDSMGLTAGEQLTVKELLYGLMLPSGNDAAVTIAEGTSGSENKFVDAMNAKASELGLVDTKYINASGLDEDGKIQYTTAYDLAVISHFIWDKYPTFRDITSTFHQYIEKTVDHKAFDLYNETNLLTTYPGVKGIKPGFTYDAGWCLVTYVENSGKRFIGVILGSDDRRNEMKLLLDYGFNSHGIKISHPELD